LPKIAAELWLSPSPIKAHTQVIDPSSGSHWDNAIIRGQETGIR